MLIVYNPTWRCYFKVMWPWRSEFTWSALHLYKSNQVLHNSVSNWQQRWDDVALLPSGECRLYLPYTIRADSNIDDTQHTSPTIQCFNWTCQIEINIWKVKTKYILVWNKMSELLCKILSMLPHTDRPIFRSNRHNFRHN